MNAGYCEKIFINPAIEYGIKAYIAQKEGNGYNRAHTFEMHVIKALTIIYGEKTILLPYKIDNEKAFECNLLMYDLKESDMKKFITCMNDYYYFMKNYKVGSDATGLITEIEQLLMEMINKRNKRHQFNEDEVKQLDSIFNPIGGDLKKIKSLIGKDNGLVIKTWHDKKYELTNTQIRLIAVNPNLLMPNEYAKYGYDIKHVALLSDDEIRNINKAIVDEMIREESSTKLKKENKKRNIVLTSGNGFVDKLMLASIIATEIMIGIVIITNIGG